MALDSNKFHQYQISRCKGADREVCRPRDLAPGGVLWEWVLNVGADFFVALPSAELSRNDGEMDSRLRVPPEGGIFRGSMLRLKNDRVPTLKGGAPRHTDVKTTPQKAGFPAQQGCTRTGVLTYKMHDGWGREWR